MRTRSFSRCQPADKVGELKDEVRLLMKSRKVPEFMSDGEKGFAGLRCWSTEDGGETGRTDEGHSDGGEQDWGQIERPNESRQTQQLQGRARQQGQQTGQAETYC